MLHRSILVHPHRPIYRSVKAGHLAGLEMENSDEEDNPRRFGRSEPWHEHSFRTGLASGCRAADLWIARVPRSATPNRDDFFGDLWPFEEWTGGGGTRGSTKCRSRKSIVDGAANLQQKIGLSSR